VNIKQNKSPQRLQTTANAAVTLTLTQRESDHHQKLTNSCQTHTAPLQANKKLSWCCQTRATRLEVSQGHQT